MPKRSDDLELYARFWRRAMGYSHNRALQRMRDIRGNSGFGSGDDPLGAQRPMVQDNMLHQLARRSRPRLGASWIDEVDPTISYGENLATLLGKGAEQLDSEKEAERARELADSDAKARDHATRAIRNNFEAIEAGDANDLIDDITAEFSADFVESVLVDERAARDVDHKPIPDPEPVKSPEPTEPVTVETPTEPTATAENPIPNTRDYSGISGFGRLVIDCVKIPFAAGYHDAVNGEKQA